MRQKWRPERLLLDLKELGTNITAELYTSTLKGLHVSIKNGKLTDGGILLYNNAVYSLEGSPYSSNVFSCLFSLLKKSLKER